MALGGAEIKCHSFRCRANASMQQISIRLCFGPIHRKHMVVVTSVCRTGARRVWQRNGLYAASRKLGLIIDTSHCLETVQQRDSNICGSNKTQLAPALRSNHETHVPIDFRRASKESRRVLLASMPSTKETSVGCHRGYLATAAITLGKGSGSDKERFVGCAKKADASPGLRAEKWYYSRSPRN